MGSPLCAQDFILDTAGADGLSVEYSSCGLCLVLQGHRCHRTVLCTLHTLEVSLWDTQHVRLWPCRQQLYMYTCRLLP